MGVIKPWNSVYPVSVDDFTTNFPPVIDAVDDVIASHVNELATAVVALETEQQTILSSLGNATSIQGRSVYNAIAPTDGQALVWDNANTRWKYGTVASTTVPEGVIIYFSPSNPTPAAGVLTTWSAVQAAIDAAGPSVWKTVYIDSSNVGYALTIPAGTYNWDLLKIVGDDCTITLAQGVSVSTFFALTLSHLTMMSAATTGASPFTTPALGYGQIVHVEANTLLMDSNAGGTVPLFDLVNEDMSFILYPNSLLFMNGTTVPVVRNSGRYLYITCFSQASIDQRAIGSSNAASTVAIYVDAEYGSRLGTSFTASTHPLWTAGTITFNRNATAKNVAVTPTGGITETDAQAALAGLDARGIAKGVLVYFTPSHPSPPPGVCTTWAQVQALLDAAGGRQKEVRINSSYVGSIINIPAGTYNWDYLTLTGDGCGVRLAQGVTISAFYNLMLDRVALSTEATSGASPLTSYGTVGTYQRIFLRNAAAMRDRGAGRIPLIDCAAGVGGVYAVLTDSSYVLAGTVPVISVSGGSLILECHDIAGIDNDAISSTNAGSTCTINASPGYAYTTPTPMLPGDRPAYTAGTFTFALMQKASYVQATPTGGIASTDVQAALAELDTEKAAVSGGQLGGTGAAPDVRGLRETSGPTLLTMGAIADGQVLARSGSTITGLGAGPYTLLWKWNQTDLTEFDQVGDGSHAYTVTTWGTRNSTDDPTPAIRMDSPATSGGFSALLVKTALLPAFTNPTKLLIVARMQNSTAIGTQDPMLIPYYESPTYFIAVRRTASNYAWCLREGSTTYVDPGVTYGSLSTNTDGAVHPYEFLLSPATGAQKPWLEMLVNRFSVVVAASSIPRARSAYAAGWTGLGSYAPRIGFGMRSFGSAAASGNCIAELAIYKVN